MTVYHTTIEVRSNLHKPMFHDVTEAAKAAVAQSRIRNGIITVYSGPYDLQRDHPGGIP